MIQAECTEGARVTVLMALRDLLRYLNANRDSLPNYGQRYRAGQPISTAWVESTVNEVIVKPMVKKQQMR
ncbi:MAG: hypothetical protein KGM47_02570 [Acidobacteriota bacterium]|nr:hypothetical protein [Acidobacteriota bacterium]